jgi:hypothetical protein
VCGFETGTVRIALEAALNYRRVRTAGRIVRKTIDSLIATFCLLEGHALLHNDRDYGPFEDVLGLNVIHREENQGRTSGSTPHSEGSSVKERYRGQASLFLDSSLADQVLISHESRWFLLNTQ